jgi:hypothetical protein
MRAGPSGFARPTALAVMALTGVAIALGRSTRDGPEGRSAAPERYHAVNWYYARGGDKTPRFLDVETGRIVAIPLAGYRHCKDLACSPWRDSHGRVQAAGLLDRPTAHQTTDRVHGSTLTRFRIPDGRLLDEVPLDTACPKGPPCWFPGFSPRILFGAGDGRLYRLSFPDGGRDPGDGDDLLKPVRIDWGAASPRDEPFWIGDPYWPRDRRFGGLLLVSLMVSQRAGGSTRGQIWWLQLRPDGRAITAAGRLTTDADGQPERQPAVTTTADGDVYLAYLTRRDGVPGWRLRLAPVTFEASTGLPRAGRAVEPETRGEVLAFRPAFSANGRWVHLLGKGHDGAVAERLAVTAGPAPVVAVHQAGRAVPSP